MLDIANCPKNTRLQVLRPVLADQKDLAMYHTEEYLQFILDPDTLLRDEESEGNDFGLEEVSLQRRTSVQCVSFTIESPPP